MRYSRHKVLLKDLNDKLRKLSVTVIGLGGLGTYISDFLVRSGIRKILLVDRDVIDLPDLHRQILYSEKDVGLPKAYVAYKKLKEINSEVDIDYFVGNLDHTNVNMLKGYDIIIDASDNLETRYLINEFSVKFNKPWIFGSVIGFKGFVGLFIPGKTPCFEEVFPEKISYQTCETYGVFNAAVAFIASLQMKLLLDYLEGKYEPAIYFANLKRFEISKIKTKKRKCQVCDEKKFVYLEGKGTETIKICGGGIIIELKKEIDLERICRNFNCIEKTDKFVILEIENNRIVITRKGTMMFPELKDVSKAKSIIAKYIGII